MSMRISILIPVSNGVEYLFEALESVLAQSYKNWECLVLLNGEGLQGPAEAVASAFEEDRIQIHRLDVSNKVDALNAGVALSKEDWFALLDADDIWHPSKLAEQVAALTGIAAGAKVVGTAAHYFGDFHGSPNIPHGWISSSSISSENPIINSSVILHRSVAHWKYPPTNSDALEDYYLWMRVAKSNATLFNLSRDLVGHRIYATSAFNARHISPAELQKAWKSDTLFKALDQNCISYNNTVGRAPSWSPPKSAYNALIRANNKKIKILTTVCNQPLYIRAQALALQRYIEDPYEFIVFNDAKGWSDVTNFGDITMRQQVEEACRDVGATCISVENASHRYVTSASHRHCDTLRIVMDYVRRAGTGRYWMIDSDMWPVARYTSADLDKRFAGLGTFVKQERIGKDGANITYAWPNVWWLNMERLEDIEGLCWDLAPACDTGGASATWVARQEKTIQWLLPHLSSGNWRLDDLPAGLDILRPFLLGDPRNKGRLLWTELYDTRLFHIRAGSNWNGEGELVHAKVAEMVLNSFLHELAEPGI